MQAKTLLTAMLALPILLAACDKMGSTVGSAASENKQVATAPAMPDKAMDSAPAAGGTGAAPADSAPSQGPAPSPDSGKAPAAAPDNSSKGS